MAQILRQSTEVIVVIGPFVDVTDGFTPETGVTLSGADEAEVLKANTGTTTSIAAATWAAITGCDGWYALTLTTSLTDTVGALTVMVNDDSVCLPVFARFQVVEEAVYDRDYKAAATGVDADWTDGGRLDLIVDAILVDTSTTLDDLIDTEIATIVTAVAAIETDTQDIQSRLPAALVNSRMDATVDATGMESGATAAIADAVWDEDIVAAHGTADTAGLAVRTLDNAGAGLTAIPWNAAWDAEVESEVDDALGGGTGTALTGIPWNAAWDAEVQSEVDDALKAAMTESYAADGAAASIVQMLYLIVAVLTEFSVSTTTMTAKKLDGSTTAATFTLDNAADPTSITRAT